MKFAFCLFKYFPFGGLERDFMRIASACAKRDHEIHVYTMSWEGVKPNKFHIHLISPKGHSNHKRAMAFSRQLSNQVKAGSFDAVIGFNRMPGLDIYFAADLCFAKTAMEKHGFWFRLTSRYRHYYALEAALFSPESKSTILTLTDAIKFDYQGYYKTPDNRFMTLPPGIKKMGLDFDGYQKLRKKYRDALSIRDNEILLLQIGSNFKLKGLARALQAIANLNHHLLSKVKFYVIGDGKPSSFIKLSKKLGIENRVTFLGGRENSQNYMLAADLLLHPAHFETAGMVLVEALTCGLPVITTESCGYASHIQNAGAGKVLPNPFQQCQFNEILDQYISLKNRVDLQKNALDYAKSSDLYSLPERVVSIIEENFSPQSHKPGSHSD